MPSALNASLGTSYIIALYYFITFYKNSVSSVVFQQLIAAHCTHYNTYLDIYTDGSKSEKYVGCGIFCENTIIIYSLDSSISEFTAELIAKEEAMSFIYHYHHAYFIIYIAYKSSTYAIQSAIHHPYVSSILKLLKQLTRRCYNIHFAGERIYEYSR